MFEAKTVQNEIRSKTHMRSKMLLEGSWGRFLVRFRLDVGSNFGFRAACQKGMPSASKNSFKKGRKDQQQARLRRSKTNSQKTNSPAAGAFSALVLGRKNRGNKSKHRTPYAMPFRTLFHAKKKPKTVQKRPPRPASRQEGSGEPLDLDFKAMLAPCWPHFRKHENKSPSMLHK